HTRSKRDWSSDVCSSDLSAMSPPSTKTLPAVGESRPAKMCRSVVLPEPDGPTIAKISPSSTAKETPWRATTWFPPFPKTLITSRSEEHTSELQSRFDLVC